MGDVPRRRMRSVRVAIGVTAVTAAALSGCTSTPDYDAVCIDEETQERVSDYECEDDYSSSGGIYSWYYIGGGQRVPSVGSRVTGGSTVAPKGATPPRENSSSSGDSSGGSSSYRDSSNGSYTDSGSSSTDYGGFGGRGSGGVSS